VVRKIACPAALALPSEVEAFAKHSLSGPSTGLLLVDAWPQTGSPWLEKKHPPQNVCWGVLGAGVPATYQANRKQPGGCRGHPPRLNASWDSWQSSHLRIDLPALASEIRRTARRAKSGSSELGFFIMRCCPVSRRRRTP